LRKIFYIAAWFILHDRKSIRKLEWCLRRKGSPWPLLPVRGPVGAHPGECGRERIPDAVLGAKHGSVLGAKHGSVLGAKHAS
jgi:hypothetical protein